MTRSTTTRELLNWLEVNMPDVAATIGPMTFDAGRIYLNKLTGLNIPGSEEVIVGNAKFLQRLKDMQETSNGQG